MIKECVAVVGRVEGEELVNCAGWHILGKGVCPSKGAGRYEEMYVSYCCHLGYEAAQRQHLTKANGVQPDQGAIWASL